MERKEQVERLATLASAMGGIIGSKELYIPAAGAGNFGVEVGVAKKTEISWIGVIKEKDAVPALRDMIVVGEKYLREAKAALALYDDENFDGDGPEVTGTQDGAVRELITVALKAWADPAYLNTERTDEKSKFVEVVIELADSIYAALGTKRLDAE